MGQLRFGILLATVSHKILVIALRRFLQISDNLALICAAGFPKRYYDKDAVSLAILYVRGNYFYDRKLGSLAGFLKMLIHCSFGRARDYKVEVIWWEEVESRLNNSLTRPTNDNSHGEQLMSILSITRYPRPFYCQPLFAFAHTSAEVTLFNS